MNRLPSVPGLLDPRLWAAVLVLIVVALCGDRVVRPPRRLSDEAASAVMVAMEGHIVSP